jgi:hypothetical protein
LAGQFEQRFLQKPSRQSFGEAEDTLPLLHFVLEPLQFQAVIVKTTAKVCITSCGQLVFRMNGCARPQFDWILVRQEHDDPFGEFLANDFQDYTPSAGWFNARQYIITFRHRSLL